MLNKTIYYYFDKGNETCFYEIKEFIEHDKKYKYRTSVSLDNSEYQYVTYFDDLSQAISYVNKHQLKNN